ncbi:hypothetical protein DTO002I6_2760 [Penicillium roqueforti]|nr:hypothetical protein DTO002I6_2760 [Penicillium roqueforti]
MSDNNPHHPGVRSLLAKFEGQSPIASPPLRGRSPTSSDSSATVRQLSKVRASFITVEGVIQSNPSSPLRKTNARSDSPGMFGPKINSADAELGQQGMISPTALSRLNHTENATLEQIMAESRPAESIETKRERNRTAKEEPAARTETEVRSRTSPRKQTGGSTSAGSKSPSSDTPSQKSDSSVVIKRKPSSVGSARNAARKSVSTTAASTGAKAASHHASPKPTAREVAKERANSLAHKPSRVSLNPKPTTARSTRGSAPAQDTSKPHAAGVSSKPVSKSPSKPARVPGSMNTSTRASTAKPGSTAAPSARTTTSASTLTRKPSTLKGAAKVQSRATTPSASVHRQTSRPSLSAQAASDTSPKHVNEGFLARMMRPTASSANKTHPQEKTDAKPIARTTSVSRSPKASSGRVPDRGVHQVKPKTTALRSQSQKSQALNKETAPPKDGQKPSQKKQEIEKENIVEPETVNLAAIAAVETASPAQVEETVTESSSPIPVENATEVPAEVDAPVEAHIEPIAEDAEEDKAAETTTTTEEIAAEPVAIPTAEDQVKIGEKQESMISEPELQIEAPEKEDDAPVKEFTVPEALTEVAELKSTDEPATEAESSNVAIDIANLALN